MQKRELIKNVGSGWFSLGVNILVGILLSPFILHRLGNTAYGAWILVFSVTGYYGLFDLGIRSSIVRYVSTYTATNDNEAVSRLINTALTVYSAIGVAAILTTLVLSSFLQFLFRMPAEFLPTARVLFLMVGTAVALGFPAGVFTGILEGLNRFYLVNVTNVVSTLLRALLIVLALHFGYGLLTVALITVTLPLLSAGVRAIIALRVLPLRFGWHYVDRNTFGEMARLQRRELHHPDRIQAALQGRRSSAFRNAFDGGGNLFFDRRPPGGLYRGSGEQPGANLCADVGPIQRPGRP